MSQFKFRAMITLGPAAQDGHGHDYVSGTHSVMVRVSRLTQPDREKYFEAVIERDDGDQLHPGDHAAVTITLSDREASEFIAPGQHFTLWSGGDIGAGIVSRQVFTAGSPS